VRRIIVSNRLPEPSTASGDARGVIPAGGLASAVMGALRREPGSLWVGWSGEVGSTADAGTVRRHKLGGVDLIGIPLSRVEVEEYYHGFCNGALWPLFHCFPGRTQLSLAQEQRYRRVQVRFAETLRPLLRPDDVVWVHDYHLLLLGREIRRLGWSGKIGFFLHVPFPPHDLWQVLPDPKGFLRALVDYDVVGFHSRDSLDNYVYCCKRQLDARWKGGVLLADGRRQRVGIYPVGIDPEVFLPGEDRTGEAELKRVVRGRRLILGVDRLDYTKGIPERILAFEDLIRRHPEWRKKVSFVQIASPSRTRVPLYAEQKKLVDALVGRINGEMAEHDWVPIRYLFRSYRRELLARFYRDADVGLVTPLRDGMNLVAKEFVAAQRREDPGVLVLSRFAGAAEDLPEAVIVNPYLPSDTADGIAQALVMPLGERRERHRALLARVLHGTSEGWARRFLDDLVRGVAGVEIPAPSRRI
jgi:trehalose 6-phosphate synthase